MPTRRRWIAAPSALVALTALTACQGSEVTVESAAPSSATTAPGPSGSSPTPGPTSTPAPSSQAPNPSSPAPSARPSMAAPAPNPITGSSIRADELGPTVNSAQNAQISFRFQLAGGSGERSDGTARCSGSAAWTLKSNSGDEIHVGGTSYTRTGTDAPYRQRSDDELELDDDNPCNFESVIDDDVTFQVVSRDASYDGRTGLTQLRGTDSGTSYTMFLEPSRRPVHVSITEGSRNRTITYRDYGAPVTITPPTNVGTGSASSSGAPA